MSGVLSALGSLTKAEVLGPLVNLFVAVARATRNTLAEMAKTETETGAPGEECSTVQEGA